MALNDAVDVVRREKRRELVLTGPDISEDIDKNGLPKSLFRLTGLNFLEINRTPLKNLTDGIAQLTGLTNLVLHGNKLETVPTGIGALTKLKLLDLSNNQIQELPDELGQLHELQTLNLSCNRLTEFPDVGGLTQIHIFHAAHNQLTEFPGGISDSTVALLAEMYFNGNEIAEIPVNFHELPSLKVFDVSDNKIQEIPVQMSQCMKLKEFKCSGNKLKDRRLGKMLEQCSTKAVLDYLHGILVKEQQKGGGGKGKDKKQRKKGKAKEEVEDLTKDFMKILKLDNDIVVEVSDAIANIRPYIVCCVVRNLNMHKSKNMFKQFINLQTKLHETECKKRQAATIATHDLASIKGPLAYDARPPRGIKVTPLGKLKETTADKLVAKLNAEANEQRKEKKRNTLTGIHKYLELLDGLSLYPCLVDLGAMERVISFPPITNSDATKVSRDTVNILVEVTSSISLDVCKKVMDALLLQMLEMGIGCLEPPAPPSVNPIIGAIGGADSDDEAEGDKFDWVGQSTQQVLVLQKARILDSTGAVKVVYPSRVDLQNDAFKLENEA